LLLVSFVKVTAKERMSLYRTIVSKDDRALAIKYELFNSCN